MPTFMFTGCYTSAAVAALIQKPEDRTVVLRALAESLGGKIDGFWLSFGEHDFVGIAQLPDSHSAATFALTATAGGGVQNLKTVELLTWAEGVQVLKKAGSAKYRPPTKSAK
ncbi:GYD domain-containing protein [soil metagenome]